MRPLVFATRNKGKLVELRELLPGIDVLSVDEAAARLGVEIPDVVEDADTFVGNASKKAREVSRATKLPALADDSGLEVDALGGAPGVISARYAGEGHDDAANNRKLLAALAGVPANKRTARFRAVLALADVDGPLGDRVIAADGACEGIILDEARGTGGFGYDPLFYSPELVMTFAEAGVGSKSELSHRARAMKAMRPQLLEYLGRGASQPWAEFMRAVHVAIEAHCHGDAEPYKALWSRADDVSIMAPFGGHETGWSAIGPRLEWAATFYNPSWSFTEEIVSVTVGADIGVRVTFEHIRGTGKNGEPVVRERRVTHVVRLEQGQWRIVHMHGDPLLTKRAPTDGT